MATANSPAEVSLVEDTQGELQESIPKAAGTLTDLLNAEDEQVQIWAVEGILDRARLKKADTYERVDAQVQIAGGEQSDRGEHQTDSVEDDDDDTI